MPPFPHVLRGRSGRIAAAGIAAVWLLFARGAALAAAQEEVAAGKPPAETTPRLGVTIRVVLPITSRTAERVEQFVRRAMEKAREQKARPVLIFEFEVPRGQGELAGGSEFTAALHLARFLSGKDLSAARTVAYIPKALPGHAVLMAMACDEIMMPGDAQLGPVRAKAEDIGPIERSAYTEIAARRKRIPKEVALWLLDPSREVLEVETELPGREYVTPEGLEELRAQHPIKSQTPLREVLQGPPGQLSGDEARRLDIVRSKPAGRQDVAKALELPPEAMEEDASLTGGWQAIRVDLKGPIDADKVTQAERLIEDQIRLKEINFVCLWMDSPGGRSWEDISRLARDLSGWRARKVRTVAYIPREARSYAALVALACDQVVMHPQAELGGPGGYALGPKDVQYAVQAVRDPREPWGARSWSLVAAMFDPQLEVFRCERPGEVAYFGDEELRQRNQALQQEAPDAAKWEKRGPPITLPGRPLLVDGQQAVQYGLASHTAESFAQFKQYFGLADDPTLLEPGWADYLVEALASPGVAALLLTIAFIALYAELHSPGIGVGGFVATVCFLLFFWSHYLGGTAGWLEIILFLAGISCLLLEIFVIPGFGIFGLGGGVLVLVSLILASQTFVLPQNSYQFQQFQRSLLTVAVAAVGIIVAAVLLRRWLPRAPIFNRMFLEPPRGAEAEGIRQREALVHRSDFVGARGTTTTQLTPCGKARFGDLLVDVIADSEVIPRGAEIEVVEVHGNRMIVREVARG